MAEAHGDRDRDIWIDPMGIDAVELLVLTTHRHSETANGKGEVAMDFRRKLLHSPALLYLEGKAILLKFSCIHYNRCQPQYCIDCPLPIPLALLTLIQISDLLMR